MKVSICALILVNQDLLAQEQNVRDLSLVDVQMGGIRHMTSADALLVLKQQHGRPAHSHAGAATGSCGRMLTAASVLIRSKEGSNEDV